MSISLIQSAPPSVKYEPYGALSAASDCALSPEWWSAEGGSGETQGRLEEEGEQRGQAGREAEGWPQFGIPNISLDAGAILATGEVQKPGHRGFSLEVFIPFSTQMRSIAAGLTADTWLASARDELEELGQLPDDWDCEGSPAIPSDVLQTVADALCSLKARFSRTCPVPAIVPVPGGRVQLEWRKADRYFEIEFMNTQTARYIHKEGINIEVRRIPVPEVPALSGLVETVCA